MVEPFVANEAVVSSNLITRSNPPSRSTLGIQVFFHLSKQQHSQNTVYSQFHLVNNWFISLDKGWHRTGNTFFKGYALAKDLKDIANDSSTSHNVEDYYFPMYDGNYVILDLDTVSIKFDNCRSFPLFYKDDTLSNLEFDNCKNIYFDGTAVYVSQWQWDEVEENILEYNPNTELTTYNQLVDFVCEHMIYCAENLITDLPIFAADSNGVDSNIVRSAFDYVGKSYKLVSSNADPETNLWGYKNIHYSKEPHVQLTGYCGDEILLRNPLYCQWQLDPYGISLAEEYDKYDHTYMLGFFNAHYRKKLANPQYKFKDLKHSFLHTRNIICEDFQMWHKDEIITFTPFRNLQLIEKCLYAEPDAIVRQCVHGDISFDVIRRLNPKNLDHVSKYKNNYFVDGSKIKN